MPIIDLNKLPQAKKDFYEKDAELKMRFANALEDFIREKTPKDSPVNIGTIHKTKTIALGSLNLRSTLFYD